MSFAQNYAQPMYGSAADAPADARGRFIAETYKHLFGAVASFIALVTIFLNLPFTEQLVMTMIGSGISWLVVLGLFMAVSWVANSWAHQDVSVGMQYAGLSLYVVAEAIIFVPILYIASTFGGEGVIPTAGIVTVITFTGLTGFVFLTRKNFSFLGPFLGIAGMTALALIVCMLLFGFSIGILFTGAMILFACAYILYYTSNVLHEYRVGQHVAASLALFAALGLLFWYVLQFVMSFRE